MCDSYAEVIIDAFEQSKRVFMEAAFMNEFCSFAASICLPV